jgi:hypothetical protein
MLRARLDAELAAKRRSGEAREPVDLAVKRTPPGRGQKHLTVPSKTVLFETVRVP